VIVICPSCAASNSCPDAAAGLTICCRKCKTQVTLPEAPATAAPPWYATRYWLAVMAVELLVVVGLVACILLYARGEPPAGLPLLGADVAGGAPRLAAPGEFLTLTWDAGQESAGGYFIIEGQRVALSGSGELELPDVTVRQARWSHEVFEPGQAPPPRPIVLEFQVLLPDDPALAAQAVTLRIAANLEYPGPSSPGGPVTVQRRAVARDWSFTVATPRQRARFAGYLRARTFLGVGVVACAALALAIGLAAVPLARRHLSVQCPKCSRITICTYYLGGTKLHVSACPHKDSRPVGSHRG